MRFAVIQYTVPVVFSMQDNKKILNFFQIRFSLSLSLQLTSPILKHYFFRNSECHKYVYYIKMKSYNEAWSLKNSIFLLPFTASLIIRIVFLYYATKDENELLHVYHIYLTRFQLVRQICSRHVTSFFVCVSYFLQFSSGNSTRKGSNNKNKSLHPLFSSPFLSKPWCKVLSVTLFCYNEK